MNEVFRALTDTHAIITNLISTALWAVGAYSVVWLVRGLRWARRIQLELHERFVEEAAVLPKLTAATVDSFRGAHAIAWIQLQISKAERAGQWTRNYIVFCSSIVLASIVMPVFINQLAWSNIFVGLCWGIHIPLAAWEFWKFHKKAEIFRGAFETSLHSMLFVAPPSANASVAEHTREDAR